MITSTERFSNRVADYIRYRPHYPPVVLDLLTARCGLSPNAVIADVGSGTGILSKLFLDNGNAAFGIEPNRAMREAAERSFRNLPQFTSIAATAEATTLPDRSVDFVTAGQAFHWFDATAAQREFARILRPDGWVVLIWNDRQTATMPFLVAYEKLLQTYGTDYTTVNHKRISQAHLQTFFGSAICQAVFPNSQQFDLAGLRGRLLSSSYTPQPGQPVYDTMLRALADIFDQHQTDGMVTMTYETTVYYGRLSNKSDGR